VTSEELDELFDKRDAFADEFKALVRKYMPQYPQNGRESQLLAMLQEQTSCYSPWIWSDG
jgi:hypothetical protein